MYSICRYTFYKIEKYLQMETSDYIYTILHPDHGFLSTPHYPEQELDPSKRGLMLPLELGKWCVNVNDAQRFTSAESASKYLEWFMEGSRSQCQVIKVKNYIYCDYYYY